MTDFWNLSDGEDITKTGASFEAGGGNIEPIPDDTSVTAYIDEAKWDASRDGEQYISLRWSVAAPAEYKNRKVFQKLWVSDLDPRAKDAEKKRDKAKRMLFAIDANAGGKLKAAGKVPNDIDLGTALVNKMMSVKVKQWKMTNETTGEAMVGNWIAAVGPRPGSAAAEAAKRPATMEDAPF